jgi:leucyl-tRNA synthetase
MGVPAHDARDYAFALKNHLKIKYIIATHHHKKPFLDDGPHIDSPLVNGLNNVEANGVIINYLIKNKLGRRHVVYHMKD